MALRVRDVTFPGNIACNCRSDSENIAGPNCAGVIDWPWRRKGHHG
jgi:hypothetical protein